MAAISMQARETASHTPVWARPKTSISSSIAANIQPTSHNNCRRRAEVTSPARIRSGGNERLCSQSAPNTATSTNSRISVGAL
jgi:hypothetical protein